MKKLQIASPEEFFLEMSSSGKHPNFKRLKNDFVDSQITEKEDPSYQISGRGNAYKHTKSGYRKDLGMNFRSNWEANFARILNAYKIHFDFEPTVFYYPIKRRNKKLHSRLLYKKNYKLGRTKRIPR